ncbi:hypothetical protein [Desulfonema ishimotonii]|uniref:hypothetical protein n=1 Tax=Desulfonema ishimotonii TaxID=45657 RepID=UPI000F56D9A3|nr:hypothetical protein [Desulfonema ishimotonii]
MNSPAESLKPAEAGWSGDDEKFVPVKNPVFRLSESRNGSAAFHGGAFGAQPFSRGWNPALPSGVAGIFVLHNSLVIKMAYFLLSNLEFVCFSNDFLTESP